MQNSTKKPAAQAPSRCIEMAAHQAAISIDAALGQWDETVWAHIREGVPLSGWILPNHSAVTQTPFKV